MQSWLQRAGASDTVACSGRNTCRVEAPMPESEVCQKTLLVPKETSVLAGWVQNAAFGVQQC